MIDRVIDVLVQRDGITDGYARYQIEVCIEAMEEVNYDPVECEEILMDHLGLEPDYLPDLLGLY